MIDELLSDFNKRIIKDGLSLRRAEALTGVSFATLSRWQRGVGHLSGINIERINAFLGGKPQTKANPISSRRMKVGSKTFIITIEEVLK
ncbi:XRE family transcriptional regulator [Candidatus Dependentiae bacterium]|nr:MAG: XRE family transcriptional regulator [Candidatus Dependentiae bacterium]